MYSTLYRIYHTIGKVYTKVYTTHIVKRYTCVLHTSVNNKLPTIQSNTQNVVHRTYYSTYYVLNMKFIIYIVQYTIQNILHYIVYITHILYNRQLPAIQSTTQNALQYLPCTEYKTYLYCIIHIIQNILHYIMYTTHILNNIQLPTLQSTTQNILLLNTKCMIHIVHYIEYTTVLRLLCTE